MLKTKDRILAELCFNNARQAHQTLQYYPAEHWYKNALAVDTQNKDINLSLGYPLALQRKWDEAIKHFTIASTKTEHHDSAIYSRGLCKLMKGDYIGGFEDIEHRLEMSQLKHINDRFKDREYWSGQACNTLYIYGEQGFGDIIMFSRYLPLIFNVKKIYYEVPKSCFDLFTYNFRNHPHIHIISDYSDMESLGQNRAFKESDYYTHIMSLCRLFKTTPETVPDMKFEAPPESVEKFKDISTVNAVAVCYGGRPTSGDIWVAEWNSRRNVDTNAVNNILGKYFTHIVPIEKTQNPAIETWSDTAGILANTKLCVSIDSGPIHLAGAMQVPTILLDHYQTCWRWTLDKPHTPWYSENLSILRQAKEHDWTNVFKELGDCLESRYNSTDEANTSTAGVS